MTIKAWMPERNIWRWASLSGAALLVLLLLVAAGWYWRARSEEANLQAFSHASQLYREATAEGKSEKSGEARKALEEFLGTHGRSRSASLAAYYLGNLLFQSKEYEQARTAYVKAINNRAAHHLLLLCQLGVAYSWEAQGQFAPALRAYQDGLAKATPKHFLYEELVVGQARMQESQQEISLALETYRGFLRDRPESPRADEIRSRIAMLEGQGNPSKSSR